MPTKGRNISGASLAQRPIHRLRVSPGGAQGQGGGREHHEQDRAQAQHFSRTSESGPCDRGGGIAGEKLGDSQCHERGHGSELPPVVPAGEEAPAGSQGQGGGSASRRQDEQRDGDAMGDRNQQRSRGDHSGGDDDGQG